MDAQAAMDVQAPPKSLPASIVMLFAVACGLAVANVYYAQPMLDTIGAEFGLTQGYVGLIVTLTQVGYGVGLILLVPLGDLLNPRRLIVGQMLFSVLALAAVGLAANEFVLMAGMIAVGLLAVVTQTLVACASMLAAPKNAGKWLVWSPAVSCSGFCPHGRSRAR